MSRTVLYEHIPQALLEHLFDSLWVFFTAFAVIGILRADLGSNGLNWAVDTAQQTSAAAALALLYFGFVGLYSNIPEGVDHAA